VLVLGYDLIISRDFSRLADAWGEYAAKSWSNRVINADSIAQELASLGGKVKALVDVFMVTLHREKRLH
jgi:hypothetical protein